MDGEDIAEIQASASLVRQLQMTVTREGRELTTTLSTINPFKIRFLGHSASIALTEEINDFLVTMLHATR